MKYTFLIDPVPASRPRVPRFGSPYYEKTYTNFRETMATLLLSHKKWLPKEPSNKLMKVEVTFYKKIPKSVSKKRRDLMHNDFWASNVDLDNLEKAIYDSLEGVIYLDDRQIVTHTSTKRWTADQARIEITFTEL